MLRGDFEELRDLRGKRITEEIVLRRKKVGSTVFTSGAIAIEMESGCLANLYLTYNEETDAKNINVVIVGTGPVCRLDVDDKVHRPAGRSHKHSLETPECPTENLARNVVDRSDLAGATLEHVFEEFCAMAHIEYNGELRRMD